MDRNLGHKGYVPAALECLNIGVDRGIVFESILVFVAGFINFIVLFKFDYNIYYQVHTAPVLHASNCEGIVLEAIKDPAESEDTVKSAFSICNA